MNSPRLQAGKPKWSAILSLLAILLISWVLWSGLYKPLVLGLGVFSSVLSVYLAQRMGFFHHAGLLSVIPRLPAFWWWLLGEIVKSSVEVAALVLNPRLPISPTVVELDAQVENAVGQVILGNTITLCPGSFTVDLHEGTLLVHCLTRESAQALQAGEAVRRTARLGLD